MTSKKANQLFLTLILTHIVVSLILSVFGAYFKISIIVNFLLSEAILMVPAILFLLFTRQQPVRNEFAPMPQPALDEPAVMPQPAWNGSAPMSQPVPNGSAPMPQSVSNGSAAAAKPVCPTAFRRIKISSILMIILGTFLLMPFVTVLNALTLFFTDNAVAAMQGDVLSLPFPVMLFMIGILGPFCEEFVFRGIIYGSYAYQDGMMQPRTSTVGGNVLQRSAGVWPILLSAFTFGLMHMNFNQAVYAFAIGVFLAFLVEAAGSLWASVICHMFFNSYEVVLMYLAKAIGGSAYMESASRAAEELTNVQLQAAIAVYLLIAAVTTPIAVCCVAWIAKNEGRQGAVRALFRGQKEHKTAQVLQPQMMSRQQESRFGMPMSGRQESQQRKPLVTVPLIVAVVLCLGVMSLEWFLL